MLLIDVVPSTVTFLSEILGYPVLRHPISTLGSKSPSTTVIIDELHEDSIRLCRRMMHGLHSIDQYANAA